MFYYLCQVMSLCDGWHLLAGLNKFLYKCGESDDYILAMRNPGGTLAFDLWKIKG